MERTQLDEFIKCSTNGIDCLACWATLKECECEEDVSYEDYKKECN